MLLDSVRLLLSVLLNGSSNGQYSACMLQACNQQLNIEQKILTQLRKSSLEYLFVHAATTSFNTLFVKSVCIASICFPLLSNLLLAKVWYCGCLEVWWHSSNWELDKPCRPLLQVAKRPYYYINTSTIYWNLIMLCVTWEMRAKVSAYCQAEHTSILINVVLQN